MTIDPKVVFSGKQGLVLFRYPQEGETLVFERRQGRDDKPPKAAPWTWLEKWQQEERRIGDELQFSCSE